MAFQKATVAKPRCKMLIVGGPKVGKTHGLLTAPKPVVVIDTEGSIDLMADRFDFESESTKDVKVILERIDDVLRGRVKCETLGIDGFTSIYSSLQLASMSANGAIEIQAWGQLKRKMSSIIDMLYFKVPCHVIGTAWTKPKQLKDVKTGEMFEGGEVIDLDRKAAFAFDIILKIRQDPEQKRPREVVCIGSRFRGLANGQTYPLPDGALLWDIVAPIFDAYGDAPSRTFAGAKLTDDDALNANRQQFNAPPTMDALTALAERAGVKLNVAWFDDHVVYPDAAAGIQAMRDRKPPKLHDEERFRTKDVLDAMLAKTGLDPEEPAREEHTPDESGKMSPITQKRLFAMLAERGIKDANKARDKELRLQFVSGNGIVRPDGKAIESFAELTEAQARFLIARAEMIPPLQARAATGGAERDPFS